MNRDSNHFYKRLEKQLTESSSFPTLYRFKFIIKSETKNIEELKSIFNDINNVDISSRVSSNNKFTSFSITAIINFTKLNVYNGLIIALLIISNVQFSIYHKYYDPLLFILFFSIFDMNLDKIKIKKIRFLHFYLFFIVFLILNFLKQSI